MSLHYILDGYNIIKQSDFLSTEVLKDARDDLLRFITDKKPSGSANHKVTVVFDGKNDVNFSCTDNKRVEIIFTHNHSADNRIKKMVEKSKNPKRIVVVSDDRELQFFIKSCGAHAMTVAEFIDKRNPPPKIPQDSTPKIELSYQEIAKINRELAKLWLK